MYMVDVISHLDTQIYGQNTTFSSNHKLCFFFKVKSCKNDIKLQEYKHKITDVAPLLPPAIPVELPKF